MARVQLMIDDLTHRLTLRTILEADGHETVSERAEVVITDDRAKAPAYARERPCLVLATAHDIRAAVDAMREGIYGYLFVPFQPGEASIMIERALRPAAPSRRPLSTQKTGPTSLDAAEAALIRRTLRQCKNNHTQAARLLGIGRNTLWRKLKKMNTD